MNVDLSTSRASELMIPTERTISGLGSVSPGVLLMAAKAGRLTNSMMEHFFDLRIVGTSRLLAIVRIPCSLCKIGYRAYRGIVSKDRSERVDSGIAIAAETGGLTDAVTSVAIGYSAIHALANGTRPLWAIVSFVASGILSLGYVFIDLHGWRQTAQCMKEIDEITTDIMKASNDQMHQIIELLLGKDNSYLKKHFRVFDVAKLKKELREARHDLKESQELIAALKGRARSKITVHKVMLVAEVIGIIGVGLLLCPPAAPVGYVLLAVSSLIYLVEFVRGWKAIFKPIVEKKPIVWIELDEMNKLSHPETLRNGEYDGS